MDFTTLREAQLHQARKHIRKLVGQCLLVVSSAITETLNTDVDINIYRELKESYIRYSSPTLPKN
jgi:hypothetical protein